MLKERGAGIHRRAGERGIRGPEYVPGDAQEMGWEGLISDLFSRLRKRVHQSGSPEKQN